MILERNTAVYRRRVILLVVGAVGIIAITLVGVLILWIQASNVSLPETNEIDSLTAEVNDVPEEGQKQVGVFSVPNRYFALLLAAFHPPAKCDALPVRTWQARPFG